MKQKAFLFYLDYATNFEYLTDAEAGKLIKCLLEYANTGKVPKMSRILQQAFIPIKKQMDADFERYADKCRKNKENVERRWHKNGGNKCERIPQDTTIYDRIRTDTNTNKNTNINTKEKERKKKEKDEFNLPFSPANNSRLNKLTKLSDVGSGYM